MEIWMDKMLENSEEKKLCECGGTLKWEGAAMTSYPPQYPYTCIKCGKGKKLSEETRKKLSEATKGKPKGKGRVHIYRNSERKMVWKQEVEEYLRQGWILGRPKRSA